MVESGTQDFDRIVELLNKHALDESFVVAAETIEDTWTNPSVATANRPGLSVAWIPSTSKHLMIEIMHKVNATTKAASADACLSRYDLQRFSSPYLDDTFARYPRMKQQGRGQSL